MAEQSMFTRCCSNRFEGRK